MTEYLMNGFDYALGGAIGSAFVIIAMAFSLILIVACFYTIFVRKSSEYRKLLVDMYVVGKIKQLAKKEDISLVNELSEFTKAMKQKRINTEALDTTIERELQEKISDQTSEHLKIKE